MKVGVAIRRLRVDGPKELDCLMLTEGLARLGHEVTLLATECSLTMPSEVRLVTGKAAPKSNAAMVEFAAWLADLRARRVFDAIISFEKGPADFFYASEPCFRGRVGAFGRLMPENRRLAALEAGTFAGGGPHLFFQSEMQRDDYLGNYRLAQDRFTLLPPVVNQKPIGRNAFYADREAVRLELGLDEGALLAVQVATAPFEKGVDRTLAALPALPALHLIVAGDRRADALRRQARAAECSDRIWFVDVPDDLPALLSAADLMVHPARTELSGRIFIDSLVAGVPVVTLVDCAYSEQVSRFGAGVVVPTPFDQETFFTLLKAMLLPQRLAAAKRAAREASAELTKGGYATVAAIVDGALHALSNADIGEHTMAQATKENTRGPRIRGR